MQVLYMLSVSWSSFLTKINLRYKQRKSEWQKKTSGSLCYNGKIEPIISVLYFVCDQGIVQK